MARLGYRLCPASYAAHYHLGNLRGRHRTARQTFQYILVSLDLRDARDVRASLTVLSFYVLIYVHW